MTPEQFSQYGFGECQRPQAIKPLTTDSAVEVQEWHEDYSDSIKECLVNTECSGIFEGKLQEVRKLDFGLYYIDQAIGADLQRQIRETIPQLEFITQTNWRATEEEREGILLFYHADNINAVRCDYEDKWVGCAHLLDGRITIKPRSTWFPEYGTVPVPAAILRETILHEMIHAVLGIGHSVRGIMCNLNPCTTTGAPIYTSSSFVQNGQRWITTWTWHRTYDTTDRLVYRLYAEGEIENGMDLDDIKRVLGLTSSTDETADSPG